MMQWCRLHTLSVCIFSKPCETLVFLFWSFFFVLAMLPRCCWCCCSVFFVSVMLIHAHAAERTKTYHNLYCFGNKQWPSSGWYSVYGSIMCFFLSLTNLFAARWTTRKEHQITGGYSDGNYSVQFVLCERNNRKKWTHCYGKWFVSAVR